MATVDAVKLAELVDGLQFDSSPIEQMIADLDSIDVSDIGDVDTGGLGGTTCPECGCEF